ncbi:MAG TPA: methylated-DNA--[protein]-cysteine S-methyltransferase [Stellaceae bacterium]|nr:methylated-DNA--[protein]-cysteine S-methyltransferase [Stellaceae bacterium]
MADPVRLFVDRLATPIGELMLITDQEGRLRATEWTDLADRLARTLRRQCGEYVLAPTSDPGGLTTALGAYFAGDLAAIDGLPVETGGTQFQRGVWAALRGIPCGETRSYGALAQRIGRASAVRAVGLANGANPVSIVVPCHRVIGSDGSLTGYGGGIERKRWLLAHEGATHRN